MPTAGERITALEAEVAALRDAVAALRLEAVPGALAALAAGQADMAAALRDAAVVYLSGLHPSSISAEHIPQHPPATGGVAVQQWGCKLLTPPGARGAPTRGGRGQIFSV